MKRVFAAPLILLAMAVAACDSTAPRGPGSIRITSTATVAEPFTLASYGIEIDGGTPRIVSAFQPANILVNGLAHGEHRVALTGLPAACSAGGGNSKTVTLNGDDTVLVAFSIVCTRTTGDIRVTTVTTGSDIDPDGYIVQLNQQSRATIGVNSAATVQFVAPGTHTVSLSGVATNCSGGGAQTVTVTAGAQATALFNVSCAAVAYLKVTSSATGTDADPDGVTVRIGQGTPIRVPLGTTHLRVPVGQVAWTIGDIQPNCTLGGATSGSSTLAANDTVAVTAAESCTAIGYGTATTVTTDVAADTLPNTAGNAVKAHDIIQVTTRYATNWLMLVMRFSRPVGGVGELSPTGVQGYIELDVDENRNTGAVPVSNSFGGSAQMGADYGVLLFDATSTSVVIARAFSSDTTTHLVPLAIQGDSIIVRIPLAKLGGDDGNLALTSTVGTIDRPTDIIPNTGVILARQPTGGTIAGDSRTGNRAAPLPATGKKGYESRWRK
jgi:hypothetical protein